MMSATETLGHWDVHGLACLPQILVQDSGFASPLCPRMMACHQNCCWYPSPTGLCVGIIQHLLVMTMYVARLHRANGVAVSSSPGGGGLKAYRPCSVGKAWLRRGFQAGLTHSIGGLATLIRPGLMESKLQAMTTKAKAKKKYKIKIIIKGT